jgi:hypothetical protein
MLGQHQTITDIDDETVLIKNQFGSKVVSKARIADMMWVGDSNEPRGNEEFIELFDAEISGSN